MNELPDTPVGLRFSHLLQMLSDPEKISSAQLSEMFHPNFLKAVGSADALSSILRSWAVQFAPFDLSIHDEQSAELLIVVEITSSEGKAVIITCTVDATEPHLITGLISRPKPRDISSLDEVEDLLSYHGAAGLSTAVIVNGQIAWARGWGVTDSTNPAPITPETILQCGSISKAVTALAALRMVDQGALDLDTDVNELLTSWRVPEVGGWQPVITIRDLLTHASGLTIWGFQGYELGAPIPSLVQVLDGSGNTPPIRSEALPGLMWRYSGGGFTVLQQAMVDVSGTPFPDLLAELLLQPLEMNDSTFEQPIPDSWEAHTASGHAGGQPIGGRWRLHPEMAAAGLWTTASDLARFLLAVVASHSGRPDALLSKRMTEEMLTGRDLAPEMGLGVFLGGSGAVRTFGHGGANAGFTGNARSTSDGSFGLVALSNSNEGLAAIIDLSRFLAKEHGVPEMLSVGTMSQEAQAAMLRAAPIEHRDPAPVPRHRIDAHVGEYQTIHDQTLRVEPHEEMISLRVGGQNPLPLYPHSSEEWVSRAIDVRVEFGNDLLRLHQLGQIVEAKKLL